MGAAIGTERHGVHTSPQIYARTGGVLYLIIIVIGALGEVVVRNGLIVSGDATATAEKIRSSEFLWRVGIAGELFLLICAAALTLIFYVLLRPVSRDLALLAMVFNLVSIAVEADSALHLLATLFPLGNANYLKVLDPNQLHAMAYLSIRSHENGFGVSLIFFGCVCLVDGYLIFRSGYLPRVIGVLMQIAGLCYLTNSFALILSPSLAHRLFPAILLPALVGEASLCLWLLVKGVNLQRWKEQASAASGSWGL
jgi:Domain of unknown function (DUF4386)